MNFLTTSSITCVALEHKKALVNCHGTLNKFLAVEFYCMIHRIYIQFIVPLTIYLGHSFPRHVHSLSMTYRTFCCFFYRVSFSEGSKAV